MLDRFVLLGLISITQAERDSYDVYGEGNFDSMWVLLKVSDDGVTIHDARQTLDHPSPTTSVREFSPKNNGKTVHELTAADAPYPIGPGEVWLSYELDGLQHHASFRNPRWRYFDWGHRQGNLTSVAEGFHATVIPKRVSAIRAQVTDGGPNHLRSAAADRSVKVLRVPQSAPILRKINPVHALRTQQSTQSYDRGVASILSEKRNTMQVQDNRTQVAECEKYGAQCVSSDGKWICTWQSQGDPDDAVNKLPVLVILSSGYLLNQSNDFCIDIQRVIDGDNRDALEAFRGVHGMRITEPWSVMSSVMNIYSVFEPSKESGASHPTVTGTSKPAVIKDTNLKCSYGVDLERALSCNFDLVYALASAAPGHPDLKVQAVLVNDPQHGGTGGTKVAAVCNGITMVETFIHELGHAWADLSDEYTYGFSEDAQLTLKNCWSGTGTVPWKYWQPAVDDPSAQNATKDIPVERLVAANPVPVCSYDNYKKPTYSKPLPPGANTQANSFASVVSDASDGGYSGKNCLMESSHTHLCAVCRQGVMEALLSKSKPVFRPDMASPRLPMTAEVAHVSRVSGSNYSTIDLFISKGLVDQNAISTEGFQVEVIWKLPTGYSSPENTAVVPIRREITNFDGICAPANSIRLTDKDCDRPKGWMRRNGNETIQLTGASFPACSGGASSCVFTISAQIIDRAAKSWAGPTLSINTTVNFSIAVHNTAFTTEAAWNCTKRDRTAESSNTDSTYITYPRTRMFPAYSYNGGASCTPTSDNPACWSPKDLLYCTTCNGQNCDLQVNFLPFLPVAAAQTNTLIGFIKASGIAVGVIGGVTILLILFSYWAITKWLGKEEGLDIKEFSCLQSNVSLYCKVVFVVLVLGTILIAAGCVFIFTRTTAELFGPNFLKMTLAGCACFWAVSWFGLASVVAKHRWLIAVTLVLVLTMFVLSAIFTYVFYQFKTDTNGATALKAIDTLGAKWREMVRDRPINICGLQREFECSGFAHSCHNVLPPTAECSDLSNCADRHSGSNLYTDSCFVVLRQKVDKYFPWVLSVLIVLSVVTFMATLSTFFLVLTIRPIPKRVQPEKSVNQFSEP